jgi:hypothetical protein
MTLGVTAPLSTGLYDTATSGVWVMNGRSSMRDTALALLRSCFQPISVAGALPEAATMVTHVPGLSTTLVVLRGLLQFTDLRRQEQ